MNNTNKYDDIINLPHHVSPTRQKMSMIDRAAQFSPFAALTGHNAAINETARLTENQIDLDENTKAVLNEKLQMISEHLASESVITFTFFEPDSQKSGGSYTSKTGAVKKIDEYSLEVVMADNSRIKIDRINNIESELFDSFEY